MRKGFLRRRSGIYRNFKKSYVLSSYKHAIRKLTGDRKWRRRYY